MRNKYACLTKSNNETKEDPRKIIWLHWLVPNSLTDCLNSDQDPVSQKSRMPKLVNKSLFMECTEH